MQFIGPPLVQSFEEILHLTPKEALRATELYRRRYTSVGLFECEVYPGLEELLHSLTKKGGQVYLATAKPLEFAKRILVHFSLFPLFTALYGPPLDTSNHDKADIIARLLKEQAIAPKDAVMVGDRRFDITAAAHCQVDSIGVLYGYGTKAELQEAGATFLASDVTQLATLLL